MTHGDPLYPTIFNAVVDAVLLHWVTMVELTEEAVEPGAADMEGFGQELQHLEEYFFAEDGLIASTQVA